MANIVIIAGHSNFAQSTANTALLTELSAQYPNADVRRLAELYPDFQINVAAEQEALRNADIIVLAFPLYWYSTPAILKKWFDDVLAYGFAYGTGAQLGGKKLVVAYTAAGANENYQHNNPEAASETSILAAFRSTAALCGLDLIATVVENGFTPNVTGDAALQAEQVAKAKTQAARVIAAIDSL